MSAAEADPLGGTSGSPCKGVGGSESLHAPRGGNRTAAHADKMCRILINQRNSTLGCIGGDLSLEHGGKRRGAGRKTAEQETPRKLLASGKRPGAGRASPRLAPTIASVVKAAHADQILINEKCPTVVGDDSSVEHGRHRGAYRRKTAEQETPRETLAGGKRAGAGRASPWLARTIAPVAEPAHADQILINENHPTVVSGDSSVEHGRHRGAYRRKTAEQETPRKTLAGEKRPGAGRASPRLAPTIAPVVEAAHTDQILINEKCPTVVGDDSSVEHGRHRGAYRRKTAEQETPRETLGTGSLPAAGGASPPMAPTIATVAEPAQTPEEFLGVVMNDPENPIQARMDAAELLMRYGRGPLPR
jgi:hypothetical protein